MKNLTDNVSTEVLADIDDEYRRLIGQLYIKVDNVISEYKNCLEESGNKHLPAMRLLHQRTGASAETRGVYSKIVLTYRKLAQKQS